MRTSTARPAASVVACAFVAAAVLLSACSTGQPGEPDQGPVTADARTVLAAAEGALLRACAAERGVNLPSSDDIPEPAPSDDRTFPFVVDSRQWAQKHGYGSDLDARRERARTSDPVRTHLEALPATERAAALAVINGSPADPPLNATLPGGTSIGRSATSCTSLAQQQLYGDAAEWFQVSATTSNLEPLWTGRVLADPRYTNAVDKWAQCMNRRGHDVATPHDAREAAYGTPAELAMASDEAACATETGLTAVVADLSAAHEAEVCAEFRTTVERKLELEQAAFEHARKITKSLAPEQIAAGASTRGAQRCEES